MIHRASFCAIAAGVIGAITLIALPAPARCAMTGLSCTRGNIPVAPALAIAAAPKPAIVANYKQQGSPTAPIACEIYSDYECPACAAFYLDVFPQLESNYVRTGKLRIVHRDFPLPMHRFALRAARYADAAGELGYYAPVFRQLFATQKDWSANADLDRFVSAVVPPGKMVELRRRLASGAGIDSSLAADMEMVGRDHVTQTPTLVFVTSSGVRTKVAGNQPYAVLARFLDEMLKR
jgi:protein-disulfide isomerase